MNMEKSILFYIFNHFIQNMIEIVTWNICDKVELLDFVFVIFNLLNRYSASWPLETGGSTGLV